MKGKNYKAVLKRVIVTLTKISVIGIMIMVAPLPFYLTIIIGEVINILFDWLFLYWEMMVELISNSRW